MWVGVEPTITPCEDMPYRLATTSAESYHKNKKIRTLFLIKKKFLYFVYIFRVNSYI